MTGTDRRRHAVPIGADVRPARQPLLRCAFCRVFAGQRCVADVAHHTVLPAAPRQAAAARRYVREYTDGFGVADRFPMDDVDVVVSEMFANAVTHADNHDAPVTVAVQLRGDLLRVEVRDRDPYGACKALRASEMDESGRGLWLVDVLSQRWGVLAESGGKVVFAEIAPATPALVRRQAAAHPAAGGALAEIAHPQ